MYSHFMLYYGRIEKLEFAMATKNRNGKHREGKIRIQISVDRKIKTILVYTASMLGKTLTDLLLDEGLKVAMTKGIVDSELNVMPEHKDGIAFVKSILDKQEGDK